MSSLFYKITNENNNVFFQLHNHIYIRKFINRMLQKHIFQPKCCERL